MTSKPHSGRWFHEYGWLGPVFPEGDDPLFAAAKALGLEFVYGGAVRDEDSKWQGYPAEYANLVEQFESLRESLMAIESCQSEGGCTRCRDEARDALKDAFRPPESHRSAPYPAKRPSDG